MGVKSPCLLAGRLAALRNDDEVTGVDSFRFRFGKLRMAIPTLSLSTSAMVGSANGRQPTTGQTGRKYGRLIC